MARGPSRICAGALRIVALGALVLASADARAGDIWVSSGAGGSGDGFHTYGGATYAPFGQLDESGLRVRVWSKAFRFTYDTTVAPGARAESETLTPGAASATADCSAAKGTRNSAESCGSTTKS